MVTMTRIAMDQPAPDGGVFAPNAFDSQVGKTVPLNVGGETTTCTITAAKVADDGLSVEVCLDVPDGVAQLIRPEPGSFSLG